MSRRLHVLTKLESASNHAPVSLAIGIIIEDRFVSSPKSVLLHLVVFLHHSQFFHHLFLLKCQLVLHYFDLVFNFLLRSTSLKIELILHFNSSPLKLLLLMCLCTQFLLLHFDIVQSLLTFGLPGKLLFLFFVHNKLEIFILLLLPIQ